MARGGQRPYGNAGRTAYSGGTRGAQSRAVLAAADKAGLSITGSPIAAAHGTSAAFTPVIAGGTAPYALSLVSGALPAGRALSGLSETGTYAAAGTYNYTLRVTDALSQTKDLAVTATIS